MVWFTRRCSSAPVTSSTAACTALCSAVPLMAVTLAGASTWGGTRSGSGDLVARVRAPRSREPEGVTASATSATPPFRFGDPGLPLVADRPYCRARRPDRLRDVGRIGRPVAPAAGRGRAGRPPRRPRRHGAHRHCACDPHPRRRKALRYSTDMTTTRPTRPGPSPCRGTRSSSGPSPTWRPSGTGWPRCAGAPSTPACWARRRRGDLAASTWRPSCPTRSSPSCARRCTTTRSSSSGTSP